ncbi:PREDICTED: uncharacterized protein LOC104602644 [Nelumbo nucifera]|uniref:Uncharacterized protein LOC104602644 n=2 Tax=Nelumbo nucifera TaxID=4432 RepID=A0A1U8APZ4_NELNU|nr:PREDICTED: uncharacterized protein LOC104602644 [Nelumbo nucifera]DAD27970.1 TPA_asm: hypothetical protein HUJ06_029438 [Nelumbo nucifera]
MAVPVSHLGLDWNRNEGNRNQALRDWRFGGLHLRTVRSVRQNRTPFRDETVRVCRSARFELEQLKLNPGAESPRVAVGESNKQEMKSRKSTGTRDTKGEPKAKNKRNRVSKEAEVEVVEVPSSSSREPEEEDEEAKSSNDSNGNSNQAAKEEDDGNDDEEDININGNLNRSNGEAGSCRFPMNRIKRIVRNEGDFRTTQESIFLFNKATELFLELFCEDAYACSVQDRKKSVGYKHLSSVVSKRKRYDFLSDFVPEKVRAEDALKERRLAET